MPHLLGNLLIFGRILRRAGVDVHPGRMIDVVDALSRVDLRRRDEVYHACRALLVHRHDQLAAFERAFEAFWSLDDRGARTNGRSDAGESLQVVEAIASDLWLGDQSGVDRDADAPSERTLKVWSDRAGLADKDFAAFTEEELQAAAAALSELTWTPGVRRTRRWRTGDGARLDLRRTIAESRRTGGEVVTLRYRRRRTRPRPLVLLCDVSGSMERYTRMLLHFAFALTRQHRRVEAFLFSTGLSRITRQMNTARVDDAVTRVAASVHDWSGGTRIGASLKAFHQQWSRRVLNGGPVVLLVSDGWDRGDPRELADQVARLQRSCHRLVWLNPLIGSAGYEPLTRGLQAALPFIDDFLPARTLSNLAELALHLNALA